VIEIMPLIYEDEHFIVGIARYHTLSGNKKQKIKEALQG
jgi:hypothetical protein